MKWQFELVECPPDPKTPIRAIGILENGVKRAPVYLRVSDLIQALTAENQSFSSGSGEAETFFTPNLPNGTIRYSSNINQTRERVTLEIPKNQWDIKYSAGNETNLHYIGFPRMILEFLVETINNQRVIVSTRLYAVMNDKQPIVDSTPLYLFPFPNVYKDTGTVCWGDNQRMQIQQLIDLQRMFLAFISAPFNEDTGVRNTLGITSFRNWLPSLEGKEFDDELLLPANKSFGDIYYKN